MATVNKDFKIKSGLIVEGTNATVNGNQILTEVAGDAYILDLIGGETLITSVESTQMEVIAGELNIKSGVFDADGSAAAAEASAIAAAGLYTDGEITTALSTAQGYANDAEADAILAAQIYTDGEVSDEVIARDAAILLAKNDAIADAASDATTKANAAEQNAKDYADDLIADEVTRSNTYADTAATTAENNAKAYADGLSSGLNWKAAVNLKVDSNINVAGNQVGAVFDGHGALSTADAGYRFLLVGQTTDSENGIWESFVDGAALYFRRPTDADTFEELVGAAVFVMEGNNYASTAWVQADHYMTTFAGQDWTQFSGQGTYLAGNGLILNGTTFEIDTDITETVIGSQAKADAAEDAAIAHTDAREIAITSAYEGYASGVALTAEENANFYTDGKITDEISDRNTAITNAINALTTSDIEEGTNEYFTDAKAKTSAADLLTGASLTNITITGTGAGLTITAENGVADSTTDDLAEGEENLYFLNDRAIDAVSGADIYPNAVIIDNVTKQVASSLTAATAGIHVGHAFAKADYRSAEFLVKVAYGTHTEISKVLLTLDTSDNIAITEYGVVGTNGSASTISAGISGTDVQLLVTTANNNSTVNVYGTLLK